VPGPYAYGPGYPAYYEDEPVIDDGPPPPGPVVYERRMIHRAVYVRPVHHVIRVAHTRVVRHVAAKRAVVCLAPTHRR
jgi:hypothetical protein